MEVGTFNPCHHRIIRRLVSAAGKINKGTAEYRFSKFTGGIEGREGPVVLELWKFRIIGSHPFPSPSSSLSPPPGKHSGVRQMQVNVTRGCIEIREIRFSAK